MATNGDQLAVLLPVAPSLRCCGGSLNQRQAEWIAFRQVRCPCAFFFENFFAFSSFRSSFYRIPIYQIVSLWVRLWVSCGFVAECWPAFYLVLLAFTELFEFVLGLCWVLLGFIGFYWVLLGFTGFYWVFTGVLLGFSRFYLVPMGFTEFLVGFRGFYSVLLGFE